jgi:hypothetical protein
VRRSCRPHHQPPARGPAERERTVEGRPDPLGEAAEPHVSHHADDLPRLIAFAEELSERVLVREVRADEGLVHDRDAGFGRGVQRVEEAGRA